MQKTLIVIEHETAKPVKGLAVYWFYSAAQAVPESYKDETQWASLEAKNWASLNPVAIGAAITDADGRGTIELPDEEDGGKESRTEQRLWYLVRQPDLAGSELCGDLVYISCSLKPTGPVDEEFLLRVPKSRLRSLVTKSVEPKRVSGSLLVDDVTRSLAAFAKLDAKSRTKKAEKRSRAAKLNARIRSRRSKLVTAKRYRASLPIKTVVSDDSVRPRARIGFDSEDAVLTAGGARMNSTATTKSVELTNSRLESGSIGQPVIRLSIETGEVEFSLPPKPRLNDIE